MIVMANQSITQVDNDTTDVLRFFRSEAGDLYMDIQVTVGVGTGPAPEPAGVHVYRIPVAAKIS